MKALAKSILQNLSYPVIVSTLALLVSVGGLWINYYKLNREGFPPEIFWNLKRIELKPVNSGHKALEIQGELEISVSNRSTAPVYIVSCKIAGDGLHVGAGGYGERLYPCEFEKDRTQEKVEPGQTVFRTIRFQEDVYKSDLAELASYRNWDEEKLMALINSGSPCIIHFSLTDGGGGWGQNCGLFDSGEQLYSILLQTGAGDFIKKEITVTGTPQWPWGRSERYVADDRIVAQ